MNPEHYFAAFTVRIDGSQFTALPAPVVSREAHLVPTFGVTGRGGNLVRYALDEPAVNSLPPVCGVPDAPRCDYASQEVFLQHGKELLQLTQFTRVDTFIGFLEHHPDTRLLHGLRRPRGESPPKLPAILY